VGSRAWSLGKLLATRLAAVQAIELSGVDSDQWRALQGDDPHPWGGEAETLEWAEKRHHVGVPGEHGELLALAGALIADVRIDARETFPVVGIGGVIVRPEMRGRGLARLVVESILEVARRLGPGRAMLFCRRPLVSMYERFGFVLIEAPVSAEQPAGRIEMPMCAMWTPLRGGAGWPPGAVEVLGEPF
jgi:GNAT superfamily N-acetyltransferase